MKKILLVLFVIFGLSIAVATAQEDAAPVKDQTEESQPVATEKTQTPEEIKSQPDSTQPAPAQTQALPKKKMRQDNFWPEDETKLKFPPTDEANSSFSAFRTELLEKLAAKDKAFLLASIDRQLKMTPGGGITAFKNFYSLDVDAKRSLVWDDLTKILKLGGLFTSDGEFCAPYVYCLWPEGVRTGGMAAIIRDDVEIKKSPGKNAETIGNIGYEIVRTYYNGSAQRSGWTQIETVDGKKGFVPNDAVRNPADYRAWFKKNDDGKWVMTTYMSGDF